MKRPLCTRVVSVALVPAALLLFACRQRSSDEGLNPSPAIAAAAALGGALHERVRALEQSLRSGEEDRTVVRELALLHHANHRYGEAEQWYERLAAFAAGLTTQERYWVADVAFHLGDLARAKSELQVVLEHEPGYLPARVALGRARLKSGEADRAERDFTAVLAREPDHLEATLSLARLELQRADPKAARKRLERLVAARPEATSAVALLAQLLEREGEAGEAAVLRERSQQRPEPLASDPWLAELDLHIYDVRLLGLRFEEHAQVGQRERAAFFLRRIEEIEPGSSLVPMLQGAAAARARRHEEAAGFYREALARGGEPEQLGPVLVQSLLALDQVDAARALMAEYHAKHPTSVPLLTAYSEVLVKQKDRPEAREILTQVLARQPYLVPQGMALAEILWGNDEHEAAAGYLQRIVQVDAKHFASRALLAEYHLRRSEPALALTRLDGALALAPAEPGVRQQLRTLSLAAHGQAIRAALSEGDAARALHHLDRTVEISPEDPQAHAARAQVLAQLGDYGRAADALERLAELQPNNPTVLLSLGDLRQRQGRLDLATRHWAAARDLVASDDEPLRAALDQRLGPSN